MVDNPRIYVKAEEKLAQLQKEFSKKHKYNPHKPENEFKGRNREKSRLKVAKQHRKIFNQRHDFLHKESRKLVDKYKILFMEDLNIRGMVRNHCLSKHISDASWGKMDHLVFYKAESADGIRIPVSAPGTSQECPCGAPVAKDLSVREHYCPVCGLRLPRDVVSGKVIKQRGLIIVEEIKRRLGTNPTLKEVNNFLDNASGELTSTSKHCAKKQVDSS